MSSGDLPYIMIDPTDNEGELAMVAKTDIRP